MNKVEADVGGDISRRLLVKKEIVYGPLRSRRLGRSLGVNLLGSGEKLCSFNCRYCQCGWTRHPTLEVGGRITDLPSPEEVTDALEKMLRQLRHEKVLIDVITFSGNGEPTLHPELETIINAVSALRNRYVPGSKLAILSNGSTVHRPEVRAAISELDCKLIKLDAGSDPLMRRINLPARGFDFAEMVHWLARLGGVLLQSMFVWGRVENTDPLAIQDWADRVAEIQPMGVQVYTIDRTPADPDLQPVPRAVLNSIADYARRRAGVPVDVY